MSTNALVAASVDTATPLSGTGLLESGSQLAAAIESGSWVEGTLAGVGVALDTAAMVIDPLGSLIGAGLGWLIDHLEPLKGWFNDFTGDAGEVAAFGQTWANIQAQLRGAGDELTRILGDVDELAGEAMDAYRRFQAEASQHLAAAASWAGAMSTGLQIAGTIVQAVHDVVRDVLSQLVGSIIAWAAEAVFTLGLATPVIVAQVSTKVASWSAKVGTTVMDALRSIGKLVAKLGDLSGLMRQASSLWESVLKGGSPSPRSPLGVDAPAPVRPTPSPRWGDANGKLDIPSILDTPTPEPPVGPVNPSSVDFNIPPDGHVFWSGRSEIATDNGAGTYGSSGIAAGLARQHDATTLELYLAENNIPMPKWGTEGAEEAWGEISRRYAESASGEVHVVLGSQMRPGNIWETRELGALQSNPHVSRIVAINPSTGTMRTIFER